MKFFTIIHLIFYHLVLTHTQKERDTNTCTYFSSPPPWKENIESVEPCKRHIQSTLSLQLHFSSKRSHLDSVVIVHMQFMSFTYWRQCAYGILCTYFIQHDLIYNHIFHTYSKSRNFMPSLQCVNWVSISIHIFFWLWYLTLDTQLYQQHKFNVRMPHICFLTHH